MPTTFTLHETCIVTAGRKANDDYANGDFWNAVAGLPDAEWNALVTAYNALEEQIDDDPEILGTKSDSTTYRIGSSPGRSKPVTR